MTLFSRVLLGAISVFGCMLVQADEHDYSNVVSVGNSGVIIRDVESNWFYGVSVSYNRTELDDERYDATSFTELFAMLGRRSYLNEGETRSFVEAGVGINYFFSDSDERNYQMFALYGIETFVSKQVTVGAAVGIGMNIFDGETSSEEGYITTNMTAPLSRFYLSYYF